MTQSPNGRHGFIPFISPIVAAAILIGCASSTPYREQKAGREMDLIQARWIKEDQAKAARTAEDMRRQAQIKAAEEELEKRRVEQAKVRAEEVALRKAEQEKFWRERSEESRRIEDKHRAEYLANPKLPPHIRDAIVQKKVVLGMTLDDVVESWGTPTKKNISVGEYGRSEQWIYEGNRFLYFRSGKLTSWQLSE